MTHTIKYVDALQLYAFYLFIYLFFAWKIKTLVSNSMTTTFGDHDHIFHEICIGPVIEVFRFSKSLQNKASRKLGRNLFEEKL